MPRLFYAAFLLVAMALTACVPSGDENGSGATTFGSATRSGDHTISGTVSAASFHVVDSTLNDPQAVFVDNGEIEAPQYIPNPAIVSGFLTVAGTGNPGDRFATDADWADYYAVDLFAGQRVTITQPDFLREEREVGLYLFDEHGQVQDSSLGESGLQVTAGSTGRYRIGVTAERGTARYFFTVGESESLQSLGLPYPLQPHLAMAEGEALMDVNWDDPDLAARLQALPGESLPDAMARVMGVRIRVENANGRAALNTLGPVKPHQIMERIGGPKRPLGQGRHYAQHQIAPNQTVELIRALRALPGVTSAVPNYFVPMLQEAPNDPSYPEQWHFPMINLPNAWSSSTGNEAIVAVLDSGIAIEHPDLKSNIRSDGWDFIEDQPYSAAIASMHGTHVAGTVSANTNNGSGVSGSGWNAKIMPVRVCHDQGCPIQAIMNGILYAAGLLEGRSPEQKADVINLSLGGPGSSDLMAKVVQQACDAGVLVVASAGNSNTAVAMYPASYPCVFSVAAVGPSAIKASYSSFGEFIDVVAPGGDVQTRRNQAVLSTGFGSSGFTYSWLQGTSMAAPHVSGVFALMRSADKTIGPQDIRSMLHAGALTQRLSQMGGETRTDEYGYGLIDAELAVGARANRVPGLSVPRHTLRYDVITESRSLQVSRVDGQSRLARVEVSHDWIGVEPTQVDDSSKLGEYEVRASSAGLRPGIHSGTITFLSDTGTEHVVNVELIVLDSQLETPASSMALTFTLEGLTTNGERIRRTFSTNGDEGSYAYEFANLPSGHYSLTVNSDLSQSGVGCSIGEFCGYWAGAGGSGEPLSVTGDSALEGFQIRIRRK